MIILKCQVIDKICDLAFLARMGIIMKKIFMYIGIVMSLVVPIIGVIICTNIYYSFFIHIIGYGVVFMVVYLSGSLLNQRFIRP